MQDHSSVPNVLYIEVVIVEIKGPASSTLRSPGPVRCQLQRPARHCKITQPRAKQASNAQVSLDRSLGLACHLLHS